MTVAPVESPVRGPGLVDDWTLLTITRIKTESITTKMENLIVGGTAIKQFNTMTIDGTVTMVTFRARTCVSRSFIGTSSISIHGTIVKITAGAFVNIQTCVVNVFIAGVAQTFV